MIVPSFIKPLFLFLAVLVATASGCGDDLEVRQSSYQVALSSFCLKVEECGGSLTDCLSTLLAIEVSENCLQPAISFLECAINGSCAALSLGTPPECAELEAETTTCE